MIEQQEIEQPSIQFDHSSPNLSMLVPLLWENGFQVTAKVVGTTIFIYMPESTPQYTINLIQQIVTNHHIESREKAVERIRKKIIEEKTRRRDLGFLYSGLSYLNNQQISTRFSLSSSAIENYQRVLSVPTIAGPFPTIWLNKDDDDGIILENEQAVVSFAEAAFSSGANIVKKAGYYTAQLLMAQNSVECETIYLNYLNDNN